MPHLMLGVGGQPVGIIVEFQVLLQLPVLPADRLGKGPLRRLDPLAVRYGGMAAGDHRLRLVVERAQQLALPAVPHARPHGADVHDGEDEKQLQTFRTLHHLGEVEDGLEIRQVTHLRGLAHQQVMAHQPGHGLRLGMAQSQPRTQPAGDALAGHRMAFGPPLGDVVQKGGDVEGAAALQLVHDFRRKRVLLFKFAAVDAGQPADGADEMLIHRVMVIHVELHQRHDAAEFRDEAAQHVGFVELAQGGLRVARIAQQVQEQPVGLRIVAHLVGDVLQGAARQREGVWMDAHVMLVGHHEQPQKVHRIATEHVLSGDGQTAVLNGEIVVDAPRASFLPPQEAAKQPGEARRGLHLALLQHGAENAGKIAHLLGIEEVVAHEALHMLQAVAGTVAHPLRHPRLHVEGELVVAPTGDEMHVAAHRPEEVLGLQEAAQFRFREYAVRDEAGDVLHPVDVLADPEQGVQIAQTALALLHVGLHEVAAFAEPPVPLVAFGQLVGDELGRIGGDDLIAETLRQIGVERLVTTDVAGLQGGGEDGVVLPREADALLYRARGIAHLEAQIPEHVEQVFGDLLAPCGLLVGQHEEQVDVGSRGQRAAAVAAHGDHRHALAGGGVDGRIELRRGEMIERGNQLVLHLREIFGAGQPLARLDQAAFRMLAGETHDLLAALQHVTPEGGGVVAVLLAEAGQHGIRRLPHGHGGIPVHG